MVGEEKRDEYGDLIGGPKISKKQKAKNLAKNEKDEKITRSEAIEPEGMKLRDVERIKRQKQLRLVKNGHAYKVVLTWRGKTYMVQMFIPSVTRPTRQEVEKQVQKLYPDAKVMSFLPRDLEPGEPTVMMGEEQHSEINKKIKNIKDDPRLKKVRSVGRDMRRKEPR